ncbi:MAG: phosphomannomutase, partial [Candidatus Roizmanbacteria bacterium]|nr:phosphomannomutase [Candidatus Roizmanbacteria bacterium]
MVKDLSIFKDYDVRGICPDQLNPSIVKEIAHAIVRKFQPKSIAMCRDMRLYGKELRDAFVEVFLSLGIDVYDAGIVGTEIQYYIAGTRGYDLVIMISASHNPKEYNGFKMVKKGPIAVTSESGMYEVRDLIKEGPLPKASKPGNLSMIDVWKEWKDKILSLVDISSLKSMKVVVDGGNG